MKMEMLQLSGMEQFQIQNKLFPTFGAVMPGIYSRRMTVHFRQGTTHPLQPTKYT